MTVYVIYMLGISVQNLFIYASNIKNKRTIFLRLALIELVILMGLRAHNIGADTFAYISALDLYKSVSPLNILTEGDKIFHFEVGYAIFTCLFGKMTVNGTAFLFLIAIIMYYPVFKVIKKYSYYPLISIFTYFAFSFFSYSLGIFRQMIALSICISGLPYILDEADVKKNNLKYLLIIALASTFHETSICFLVLFFIRKVDIKRIQKYVLPVTFLCIIFGRFLLNNIILRIVPQYGTYIGNIPDISVGYILSFALIILIYFAVVFFVDENDMNSCERLAIRELILAIFLQAISFALGLMGRALVYFTFSLLILIPMLIKKVKIKNMRWVIYFITWSCLLLLTIYTQFWDNKYICPFRFFWET